MAEEVKNTEEVVVNLEVEQPIEDSSKEEFDMVVGVPPSEDEGEKVDAGELAKQLEELKNQNASLASQANSTEQLKNAFESFATKLTDKESEASASESSGPPQVQIDWSALEGEVNNSAFKNPFQAQMKAMAPVVQQLQNQMNYEFEQLKKKNQIVDSKLELNSNKDLAGVYEKYRDEVEAGVRGGADYVSAAKAVQMAHVEDIIGDLVKVKLEEAKKELEKVEAKPAAFTNSGNQNLAGNKDKVKKSYVFPNEKVKGMMTQKMLDWGLNPQDADDVEYAYNEFKQAGLIK